MIASVNFSASSEIGNELEPFVELKFPVRGKYLPADHGYGIYAAFVRIVPQLRQADKVSILTVPGFGDKQGKIILTDRSYLRIRVPVSQIPMVYQLAGKRVSVGIHEIQIGIPEISILRATTKLRARIVTIKGYTEPNLFLGAVQRQLHKLGISGEVYIPRDRQGNYCRKTIKVKRYTIVGFTTEISGLSDNDSLKLQEYGLGGKRHMGCGIFIPCQGVRNV